MNGMRSLCGAAVAALALGALLPPAAARAQSSPSGSIVFEAQVTPTNGRPEPMRQLTFYLLRKSYADIQKEAEDAEAKPDMERFIDDLTVSKELKDWMKKQKTVELNGEDFLERVKTDNVFAVPEFLDAWMKENSGGVSPGFPTAKFKDSDKQKFPAKYEKLKQDYQDALRKYLENHPQSRDGMDNFLEATNPGQRWAQLQAELRGRLHRRVTLLAQQRYLAGKTDADLNGRGTFSGLAPGDYWISNLDTEAVAGDAHLRWDAQVTVRAGETARVELSNLNAMEPRRPAP
jgi:hypothetical protein